MKKWMLLDGHKGSIMGLIIIGGMIMAMSLANASTPFELSQIRPQTQESQGIYGDAIKVIFNQSVWPHAVGPEAVLPAQNSPVDENSSINPARNYTVKIIPNPSANRSVWQGTWADLGGRAKFDPNDPQHRTVWLYLPTSVQNRNLYAPEDRIEVTVSLTVIDADEVALEPNKNKANRLAD